MSIFKYYNENTGQWEPMTVASEIKKATESNLGGVKAKNAVSGDIQEVHIDNNGFLVTKPGGEDQVMMVTFTEGATQDGKTTVTSDIDYAKIHSAISLGIPVFGQIKSSSKETRIFSATSDGNPRWIYFTRLSNNGTSMDKISLEISETGILETIPFPSGGGGAGAVSSVNGRTGAVTLDASDVGAIPETSGIDGQYAVSNGVGGIRFISGGSGTNNIFVVNFVVSGENITSDKTSTEVIDAYNQKKICVGMLKDGGFNRMLTLTEIDTRYNSVFFGVINYDGDSIYSNYIYLIENEAVRYRPSIISSVNFKEGSGGNVTLSAGDLGRTPSGNSGTRGQFAISNGTGGLDFITLQNAAEVAL